MDQHPHPNPFRVIPVLDLLGGRVVHARGGRRDGYRPPVGRFGADAGDPFALARAFRDELGASEIYVADLDAIDGRSGMTDGLADLAGLDLKVWLDPGVRGGPVAVTAGVSTVIAASETLEGPDVLRASVEGQGVGRVAFGCDLRSGEILLAEGSRWRNPTASGVVCEALDAGVRRFVVLDLGRVGAGAGVGLAALDLLRRLKREGPGVEVVVGGGVRGLDDLLRLRGEGADAALVASALHDGRVGPAEVREARSGV